jgi:N-acylneuraminate cytidylyltransferase
LKILALIPARAGSKRLPGKNIRLLGGKPLITWSIDVAKNIPEICDILVSTDDQITAEIAIEAGALVPWLRPAELATDTASSVEVALHALDWYEYEKGKIDGLLLLQPTSPFRTKESILNAISLFINRSMGMVLAVSHASVHPMWMLKMQEDQMVPLMPNHGFRKRSQDLPPVFFINGSLYLISPSDLRRNRSFVGHKINPLTIDSEKEIIDIDTEWDFTLCDLILNWEMKNSKQLQWKKI